MTNAIRKWKPVPIKCALLFGLSALLSTMAHTASAGCGLSDPAMKAVRWITLVPEGARFTEAVYRPNSGGFMPVGHQAAGSQSGIEGLWTVTFISDGIPPNPVPSGVMIDFGTVQWHSDGTELMISGGRPPSTGDVCMGVCEQIGPFTYKLKHLALSWVSSDTPPSMGGPGPSPAQFLGPATIAETVTLSKTRASYSGTFTIDQYNADESMLLVHVSGTVTGTRVTVD